MAAFFGRDILVYVGDQAIAGATNHTLNLSAEETDITTKDSEGWKEILSGTKSWSIDVEALADFSVASEGAQYTFSELLAAWKNGSNVSVKADLGGGVTYGGNARVLSLTENAPSEDKVTYSATLTGNGPFEEVAVS